MNVNRIALLFTLTLVTLSAGPAVMAEEPQPLALFDFTAGKPLQGADLSDAWATVTPTGALRIQTGHEKPWPGVTIKAPAGKWDLWRYRLILMDVKNTGGNSVTVNLRVDNPGADGVKNCITENITVAAGESLTMTAHIFSSQYRLSEDVEIIGMRGFPVHSGKVDTSNITQLVVFVTKPTADHCFEISNIRAVGGVRTIDAEKLFPMIDEFGQFMHADWPGKTGSVEDMKKHAAAEKQQFAGNGRPSDRDKYGGFTKGPAFRGTGLFRVEKYGGKWWIIDPAGRLFWSHGIDCVGMGNMTPISDREHYFQGLPESNSASAKFYGTGSWAPHGYYKDHSPYKTFDFSGANLMRKYGQDFGDVFAEITHRRLASWGLNTIANWSSSSIYRLRKTPYVVTISFNSRYLEGSQGYWGKFYDVFDPSFRQKLADRLKGEVNNSAGDPWCLGYFVHNELAWGDETSLAVAALVSPAEQPAKKVFVDDLKAKYASIDKLNQSWGSSYGDFDAVLNSTTAPDKDKVAEDLHAFYSKTAETYFRVINEEVKRIAPDQLYMGCRFAWVNDRAVRAAAKYCDIISFNRYSYSVASQGLPEGIDKPIIIGEFHFGALDRGMLHTGLRQAVSQADRARKYTDYVLGALENPLIVGTHWFQYKDQATTGRGDGENYQIGFIDIADRPYPEITTAARAIGEKMYSHRLSAK